MNKNLTIHIGIDEYGKDLAIDLTNSKGLLIGGCTGSGKSVLLHRIVSTLIANNSPEALKFILIDPKRVEFNVYEKVPQLLTPVIFDPKKAILAMKWTIKEINRRLDILKENNCRNISEYRGKEGMPSIAIVIDELSDLMLTYLKETEPVISKIAEVGDIVGVYIILSTSRPSLKVFTRDIRNAISTRIALQTTSAQDSKLIMGIPDACKLNGVGDMLFREGSKYPIRAQATAINYKEIEKTMKKLASEYQSTMLAEENESFLKNYKTPDQYFTANSEDSWLDGNDELYDQAKEIVLKSGKASTSWIQRKMGIGYSRSAKLLDLLEEGGVVGPAKGSSPREVYVQAK